MPTQKEQIQALQDQIAALTKLVSNINKPKEGDNSTKNKVTTKTKKRQRAKVNTAMVKRGKKTVKIVIKDRFVDTNWLAVKIEGKTKRMSVDEALSNKTELGKKALQYLGKASSIQHTVEEV